MKKILFSLVFLLPEYSFAFFDSLTEWRFTNLIYDIIILAVPIILLLSLIYFIYSIVVRFTRKKETKKKRNWRIVKSFSIMTFIIFIWGFIGIMQFDFYVG